MLKLQRITSMEREHHQVPANREQIAVTREVRRNARVAVEATKQSCGHAIKDTLAIETLRQQIIDRCRLGDRVVDPVRR